MAKAYNVGDRLYLPVWITNKESNLVMYKDNNELVTDAKFSYVYSQGETRSGEVRYGEPDLLLTAEEIYASRRMVDEVEHLTDMLDYGRKKYDEIEELKSRNAELEALLKEVMATRDEAIRQNDELISENEKLKDGADKLKDTLVDRTKDVQHLTEENAKLKTDFDQCKNDLLAMKKDRDNLLADNKRTTAYYMEANRTASEAAEANDELKGKIAELRSQVGKYTTDIQDMAAEIHFLKEERDLKAKLAQEWHDNAHSTAKGLDELKGRYDELDSVNKEQAEKIRRQDKALTDLKQMNDKLRDENANLTFLLEAQPEEDKKKSVHIVLNDGTEIEFKRKDIQVFYRTDIDMLVINDGDEVIAGFDRGDNPTNFAYFFMG